MTDINDLEAYLETAVNAHTLSTVLDALTSVCHGKAEHLTSNWQDDESARVWTRAAHSIAKASATIEKSGI